MSASIIINDTILIKELNIYNNKNSRVKSPQNCKYILPKLKITLTKETR
jgi:hypothetical protein